MKKTVTCPICNGSGQLPAPNRPFANRDGMVELRKVAAVALDEKGFSIREIMRLLGLKSPRSVSIYLGRGKKEG